METEILKIICANQGAVDIHYLLYYVFFGDQTKERDLEEIISNREKFVRWRPNGQVVARTHLRLCRVKDCPGTCRGLHLCKNFLFSGFCQFSQLRVNVRDIVGHLTAQVEAGLQILSSCKPEICVTADLYAVQRNSKRHSVRGCSFSHELTSDHNQRLLREHELESLSREELCTLLLQSDHTLLPDICYNYNNGDGEFGRCKDGDVCRRLHICENYISRECSCWKNHNFNAPQPFKALQARGIPDTLFQSLKAVYANKQALRLVGINREDRVHRGNCSSGEVSANDNNTDESSLVGKSKKRPHLWDKGKDSNQGSRENTRFSSDIHAAVDNEAAKADKGHNKRQRTIRDKTEICMYFIKGHCKHEDRCYKAHDKMPYRWQVQDGVQWTPLPDNETIERDYCYPSNSYSSTSPAVHFDTMTCGPNKVRRLTTENSLIEPTFIHTTEWLWYWQDEFGRWNVFASAELMGDVNHTKRTTFNRFLRLLKKKTPPTVSGC